MTENAILSILAQSSDLLTLHKLRMKLSHVAYISLRYQLARLGERGIIEKIGDGYGLTSEGVRRVTMSAQP